MSSINPKLPAGFRYPLILAEFRILSGRTVRNQPSQGLVGSIGHWTDTANSLYRWAMFGKFFSIGDHDPVPREIYGRVVAQSRLPAFYQELKIPDTVAGRYDMLSLHMFLLSHRLADEEDIGARPLSQAVFDCFTANIDDALRQLGIGDTSVPKHKKRLVRQFYGHIAAFADPLKAGDAALLHHAMNKRFYDESDLVSATLLADYASRAFAKLRKTSFDTISRGTLEFPQDISSCTPETPQ